MDTANEMKVLLSGLGAIIPEELKPFLIAIAQWHDAGKAHPVFQTTLGGSVSNILAKSPIGARHSRKGFRHELASALMALAAGKWYWLVSQLFDQPRNFRTRNKLFQYSQSQWQLPKCPSTFKPTFRTSKCNIKQSR